MIGGLKEYGTFAGEKKGTFFLVIQFYTHVLDFKAYINFIFQEYPIRCLLVFRPVTTRWGKRWFWESDC